MLEVLHKQMLEMFRLEQMGQYALIQVKSLYTEVKLFFLLNLKVTKSFYSRKFKVIKALLMNIYFRIT